MVADPLRDLARRHGPRRAVSDRSAGFWATWFDVDDLAHTWARRFESLGLRPGHRVAVMEPAGVRFAALLHACLRSGAAIVPVSPRWPAAELERVLADCRPLLLVADGEVERRPEPAPGEPEDACVLYTSGTTGPPKGVRLTLANHVASARGCQEQLGTGEHDRWLALLAPHHVGGLAMFLRAAICNQPLVTLARFDAAAALEAMEADRPSLLSVAPTMLARLVEAGGVEQLRRLRAILVGGAPAGAEQVRRWAALGIPVCPTYGMTETCSQVTLVPPGHAAELAGTAGTVCPHARIEIEDGEIVVTGPAVSPGYVNRAITPAPGDGRFRTGDLGRLDDGVLTVLGRLDDTIITGGENVRPEEVEAVLRAHPRVADAAVAGRPDELWGEIVAAWVVAESTTEPDLAVRPKTRPRDSVARCPRSGGGAEERSERPPGRERAPQKPTPETGCMGGEDPSHYLTGALDRWCRERLPAFKVPRRWTFLDRLPRSEGGKVLRKLL